MLLIIFMKKSIENYVGDKYEETKNLSLKEICKLLEKDLKLEIKKGSLPKGKYQIEISDGYLPESIDVYAVLNLKEFLSKEKESNYMKLIKNILNKYNKQTGILEKDTKYRTSVNIWTSKEINFVSENAKIID